MRYKKYADGGVDSRYFESLAAGHFEIPHCNDCEKFHFYPRILCPHCGSPDLAWILPSGKGTVYATTVVRRKTGDYNVALIDLQEGPRMMSRVEGIAPGDVQIGLPVSSRIEIDNGDPLLVFVPEAKKL
ncbi:Zn-ribbon domain-containing OB-fold protein [Paeniglutamicibacter sp. MACA_103]|uniref:Zn-ribbon domain-containing OB-fold protein n=1 Tax=Paeniglutamicibacter sp. MACA_103 TaxID=3377337 RepID=UPI003894B927